MSRKPVHPDQMTFNFTSTPEPLALEGGDQVTLSPFERKFRQVLRQVFDDAGKRDGVQLERAEIAARMAVKLGRDISKSHLDQWTAPSTPDRRMHVDALKAICEVTDDYRLLHCFAEACGFKLLTPEEAACAEYGARALFQKMLRNDMRGVLQGVDESKLRQQLMGRLEGGVK